jgi:lysophospholipase L1-like esterase
MKNRFPTHALFTASSFLLVMRLMYPHLHQGKEPSQQVVAEVFDFNEKNTHWSPRIAMPHPSGQQGALVPGGKPAETLHPLLNDANGSMDHFYLSLLELEQRRRNRPVRVAHYGDSPTTADLITGDVRELLQERWGDAGHGFILIAKPWAWYSHRNVDVSGSGWAIDTAVGGKRNGEYGYGGAAFDGSTGAKSRLSLADGGYTKVELSYMASPSGGLVSISANGKQLKTIDTRADDRAPAFAGTDLPADSHTLDLRVSGGKVRLFGVVLSKATNGKRAGITYDSLGLNGATTMVLSRIFNQDLWATELQHRSLDLVIINYGTNESGFQSFVENQYEGELRMAIQRVRAALPAASILVMSPMDRGQRMDGEIRTMPTIPQIVDIQRKVASETGCAFFDTYDAMGGDSTMERWYDTQPRMVAADLIHPSPKGARLVAEAFVNQIEAGYMSYRQRHLPQMETAASGQIGK